MKENFTNIPFSASQYFSLPKIKKTILKGVYFQKIQQEYHLINYGLGNEIAKNKLIEKELQKSEERFRGLLNNLEAGVVIHSSDTSIIMCNPKAEELLGITEFQMRGKLAIDPEWKFLDESETSLPIEKYPVNQILNNRQQIKNFIAGFNRPKTKDIVWLMINGFPIIDKNGKIDEVVISFIDITEYKWIHNERNERERILSEAQNIAKLGTYEMDILTGKWKSSSILDNIFEIDSDFEKTFENWSKIVHPEWRKDMVDYFINEVIGNKISFDKEYKIIRLIDKEERWVHGLGKLKFDKNNLPIKIVGTIRDITDRKMAELERIKITADLVRQNKNLEQFAYIVSHNLRAPIANIIGLTSELASADLLTSNNEDLINGLIKSGKLVDDVIKDINDVLHIRQTINERKEVVVLSQLVSNIEDSISSIIEKNKAVIISDFSVLEKVTTIKSYIYSIFYNLITNSIKYKKTDSIPIIKITSDKFENKIYLRISDNGIGFDLSQNKEKIFGLYKRFNLETEGRGLGLYMVKVQVEALGGTILLNSELNKGAEFIIEFDNDEEIL